jgi:outer membrane lipoprotein SlyB
MILAAVAVALPCLVGTGAIMGWLPSSIGGNSASRQLSDADRMALSAGAQQSTPARPVPAPAHEHATGPVKVAAAEAGHQWCSSCGNIESVRTIITHPHGSGLGAAGGAALGNQVEGNMHAATSYEIRVRLDDGTLRTFHQASPPSWRTGKRVRIVKGHLRPA